MIIFGGYMKHGSNYKLFTFSAVGSGTFSAVSSNAESIPSNQDSEIVQKTQVVDEVQLTEFCKQITEFLVYVKGTVTHFINKKYIKKATECKPAESIIVYMEINKQKTPIIIRKSEISTETYALILAELI